MQLVTLPLVQKFHPVTWLPMHNSHCQLHSAGLHCREVKGSKSTNWTCYVLDPICLKTKKEDREKGIMKAHRTPL